MRSRIASPAGINFWCAETADVQRAVEEAKSRGLGTISFLGRDGGAMINTADVELVVRGESTARIQEAHMLLLHVLCQVTEARLAAR
jgi:D-sedoheptulose 7-phosphate isomerase